VQYRDPAGFEQCAEVLAVPFKKAPVASINYLTTEEISVLFLLPDQKDDSQLRDLSILVMLYESGARVQELLDLCPRHIRFSSTTVVELHGKGNKTRLIPINADAAGIISLYTQRFGISDAGKPLFVNRQGEKLTRAGIQYIIDKYMAMARAGRPDLFKNRITNHCFRHSKAMHLLEAGVNLIYIRDFLGHTSVVTTEIYAKTNPKIKEEHLLKHSSVIVAAEKYSRKQKEDLINWLKSNL
jgi:site-specific recombinase XerD